MQLQTKQYQHALGWVLRLGFLVLLLTYVAGCGRMSRSTNQSSDNSSSDSATPTHLTFQQPSYQIGLSDTLNLFGQMTGGTFKPESVDFYTSDPHVASVASDGKVKPQQSGLVTIKAVLRSNRSISANVTVLVSNVTSTALSSTELTVLTGATHTLSVQGQLVSEINWVSLSPGVATIHPSNGLVTAKAVGKTTVVAFLKSTNEWIGECEVTVESRIVGVTIPQSSITIEAGRTFMIPVSVQVAAGSPDTVSWQSSNPLVVSQTTGVNMFLARSAGSATITARSNTDPTKFRTVSITVTPPSGLAMSLYPVATELVVGTQLAMDVVAPLGSVVSWESSNPGVASVSASGVVSALQTGSATITAQTSGIPMLQATSVITVVPALVQEVTPVINSVELSVSELRTLQASVYPGHANQGLTWSVWSGASVVDIAPTTGEVSAKVPGRALVKCQSVVDASKYALIEVVVKAPPVTSIALNNGSKTMAMGEGLTLVASVSPALADTRLIWETTDFTVAEVNNSGIVTAKLAGTTTITARSKLYPLISQSCVVTVVPVQINSVTIGASSALTNSNVGPVLVGYEETVSATVGTTPASQQNVIWMSSNPNVARISSTGRLVMVGAGTAVITAYSVANPTVVGTLSVKANPNNSETYRIVNRAVWVPEGGRSNQARWFTESERTYLRGLNGNQPYAWEGDMTVDWVSADPQYVYLVIYFTESQSNHYTMLTQVKGVVVSNSTEVSVQLTKLLLDPLFPPMTPVIVGNSGVRMIVEIRRGVSGSFLSYEPFNLATPLRLSIL